MFPGRLRLGDELDGFSEALLEFVLPFLVVRVAVDAGEEERGEALGVHVPLCLAGVPQVGNQSAVLHAIRREEPVHGILDFIAVLPFLEGASLHQESHAGQRCHRGGIGPAGRGPVPVRRAAFFQPLKSLRDRLIDAGLQVFGFFVVREQWSRSPGKGAGRRKCRRGEERPAVQRAAREREIARHHLLLVLAVDVVVSTPSKVDRGLSTLPPSHRLPEDMGDGTELFAICRGGRYKLGKPREPE